MRTKIWDFIKRFLFMWDAERVHRVVIFWIKGLALLGRWPLRALARVEITEPDSVKLPTVLGMTFQSRLGLAAGFDKDAEILGSLPDLGFGFAEIGTVTPQPQIGNEMPRLFRHPETYSLFNRMGFNGAGAAFVAKRVAVARETLPPHFRVGVNLGKNKDTPLENAGLDYQQAAEHFKGLADYFAINVSSPNTPGLRSLQTPEGLKSILLPLAETVASWSKKPPLLIKLAPELTGDPLKRLIEETESLLDGTAVQGWILTNTWAGSREHMIGGWSGGTLTEISRARLIEARRLTQLPIISVGGILTVEEAIHRIRLGADLIQIYSAWVYQGPGFPQKISQRL